MACASALALIFVGRKYDTILTFVVFRGLPICSVESQRGRHQVLFGEREKSYVPQLFNIMPKNLLVLLLNTMINHIITS